MYALNAGVALKHPILTARHALLIPTSSQMTPQIYAPSILRRDMRDTKRLQQDVGKGTCVPYANPM